MYDAGIDCNKKGNAFVFDAASGKCTYSFDGATLTSLTAKNKDTGATYIKGFNLAYTSAEACEEDSAKKFTFNLMGVCDKFSKSEMTGLGQPENCS